MFRPESEYIEACWLPILGPTSTWLYRRLGELLMWTSPLRIESLALAQELGISQSTGPNSPLWRSLNRLIRFDGARWAADRLLVANAMPPLSYDQRARLTTRLLPKEKALRTAELS
ncbi:MAG: hypothetical protein ACYDA2_04260 [Acidimicrobiales bacterium]